MKRIGRLISCEQVHVAEERKSDRAQVASAFGREAERIRAKLDGQSHLVCLDERGTPMTSRKLAKHLKKLEESGPRELVLLVGGFMGIPPDIQSQAVETWSLGPMTLPHELARLVLVEQTYRALTLIRGLPYHR